MMFVKAARKKRKEGKKEVRKKKEKLEPK